jgi:hypothetical protein
MDGTHKQGQRQRETQKVNERPYITSFLDWFRFNVREPRADEAREIVLALSPCRDETIQRALGYLDEDLLNDVIKGRITLLTIRRYLRMARADLTNESHDNRMQNETTRCPRCGGDGMMPIIMGMSKDGIKAAWTYFEDGYYQPHLVYTACPCKHPSPPAAPQESVDLWQEYIGSRLFYADSKGKRQTRFWPDVEREAIKAFIAKPPRVVYQTSKPDMR